MKTDPLELASTSNPATGDAPAKIALPALTHAHQARNAV